MILLNLVLLVAFLISIAVVISEKTIQIVDALKHHNSTSEFWDRFERITRDSIIEAEKQDHSIANLQETISHYFPTTCFTTIDNTWKVNLPSLERHPVILRTVRLLAANKQWIWGPTGLAPKNLSISETHTHCPFSKFFDPGSYYRDGTLCPRLDHRKYLLHSKPWRCSCFISCGRDSQSCHELPREAIISFSGFTGAFCYNDFCRRTFPEL